MVRVGVTVRLGRVTVRARVRIGLTQVREAEWLNPSANVRVRLGRGVMFRNLLSCNVLGF
jgi:hypothetical protein